MAAFKRFLAGRWASCSSQPAKVLQLYQSLVMLVTLLYSSFCLSPRTPYSKRNRCSIEVNGFRCPSSVSLPQGRPGPFSSCFRAGGPLAGLLNPSPFAAPKQRLPAGASDIFSPDGENLPPTPTEILNHPAVQLVIPKVLFVPKGNWSLFGLFFENILLLVQEASSIQELQELKKLLG